MAAHQICPGFGCFLGTRRAPWDPPRFVRLPAILGPLLNTACYAAPVDLFIRASDDDGYSPLSSPPGYKRAPEAICTATATAVPACPIEEANYQSAPCPSPSDPWIHVEFDIPRLGLRVDAVLVTIRCAHTFQVPRLELDWPICRWDADLRWSGVGWSYNRFPGARWTVLKKPERRQHLKDGCRVLHTRARRGMAVLLPPGAKRGDMRHPGLL